MRKANCRSFNCVIYKQLADVRISEIDRRRAEYALRDAHAIVDVVIWVKERMASLGAILPKPSYKHQE